MNIQGRLRPGDGEILNRFPTLKVLNIGGVGVGACLLQMGDMDQIEELNLSITPVPAASLEALHENLGKTLIHLAFGGVEDDSSAAVDVAIRRFRNLGTFYIRGKIFPEILIKLPTLKELNNLILHQAQITPESLQAISECQKLTNLTLGNGRLTAKDISALRRLADLKALTLHDNGIQIDPAVIPDFAKLDQLTQLNLPESQSTEEQIAALSKAMPDCTASRVHRYP